MKIKVQLVSSKMLANLVFLFAASGLNGLVFAVEQEQKTEDRLEIVALQSHEAPLTRRFGEHVVTQVFFVDADVAKLNFSCEITSMKIESNNQAAPLLVDASDGCSIEVPGAIASIGGGSKRIAPFKSGQAVESEFVTFQTIDGSPFQQDVFVSIAWKDSSAMQMAGKYKGAVKLVAAIPNKLEQPH